jgi:flagellar assembly factor FliW
MKIDTTRFGELEVNPQAILTFPRGLAGFENCTRFQLLHEETAGPVVFYLQSVDDAAVSFSIVDPALFGLNYELTLSDEEAALLQADEANEVGVVLIVYKQQTGAGQGGVAANINGPLVINLGKKLGIQKVLVGPKYDVTLRE